MDRYIVVNEKMQTGELFLSDGRLIYSGMGDAVLKTGIKRLLSLSAHKNDLCLLYQKGSGESCAAVFSDGAVKSEKILFKNSSFLQSEAVLCQDSLKIFTAENTPSGISISQISLSSESNKATLCQSAVKCQNSFFRLFSSAQGAFCAFLTSDGLVIKNCSNENSFTISEKGIRHYSLCFDSGFLYCLCALKNVLRLYILNENGETEKTDVIKGKAFGDCFVLKLKNTVFSAVRQGSWLYFRYSQNNGKALAPMGKIPLSGSCAPVPVISLSPNLCCCDALASPDVAEAIKNIPVHEQTQKAQASLAAQAENKKKNNVFDEALSKNISRLSQQNSLMSLRFKAAQERYVSEIEKLNDALRRLEEKNNTLESENAELKKEKERLEKENALLKKAKAILEEEIYKLNNSDETTDETDEDESKD